MSALTYTLLFTVSWLVLPPAPAVVKDVQNVSSRVRVRPTAVPVPSVQPAFRGEDVPLVFLTGEGLDPFALRAQNFANTNGVARSEGVFYRSLETAPNGRTLLGASWDELYRVNPINGRRALFGKVRGENTFRGWFNRPTDFEDVALPIPTIIDWTFRATVEAPDVGTDGYFDVFDTQGTTEVTEFELPFFFLHDGTIYDDIRLNYQVHWGWDFPSIPLVRIHVNWSLSAGGGVAYSQGMVGAQSEAMLPENEDATLPLAGISYAPDGALMGLSESDWDVHGGPSLYELTIESNGVRAVFLCQPEVPLTAIEFLDDGTLIGAGDSLYEVNPETCATLEIGTSGVDAIADMDAAADGSLYGVTLPQGAPSELVTLLGPPPELRAATALYPAGPHWGLATQQRRLNGTPSNESFPGGER